MKLGPATLSLAFHCETSSGTKAVLQHVDDLAGAGGTTNANPSNLAGSPGEAGCSSSGLAGAYSQFQPGLGLLAVHPFKLNTLRLYLENPDFAPLRALSMLTDLRDLSLLVCYTSHDAESDLESDSDASGFEAQDEDESDLDQPLQQAQAAAAGAVAGAGEGAQGAVAGGPAAILPGLPQLQVVVQGPPATAAGTGSSSASDLSPKHVLSAVRHLKHLTSLVVREEVLGSALPEDAPTGSHPGCMLNAAAAAVISHSFRDLTVLEWQGMVVSPHPSALSVLTELTGLKSMCLGINQDDPVARVGVHCLPSALTSLTLQSLSVVPAPLGAAAKLPCLSHLHLKSCCLPSLSVFSAARGLEWLNMDNCDMAAYVGDVVELWPDLSWLEVHYTHSDWRMFRCVMRLAAWVSHHACHSMYHGCHNMDTVS